VEIENITCSAPTAPETQKEVWQSSDLSLSSKKQISHSALTQSRWQAGIFQPTLTVNRRQWKDRNSGLINHRKCV